MFKDLTTKQFFEELSAKEPAPGGGAASASVALHGISLARMVINFTTGTSKNAETESKLQMHQKELEELNQVLMMMVDVEDGSFAPVLKAMSLPKDTEEEKKQRREMLTNALAVACDSPKAIMIAAKRGLDVLADLVEIGNPFLISDTLAGIRFMQTTIETASYNIIVNTKLMKNEVLEKEYLGFVDKTMNETNELSSLARRKGMATLMRQQS